MLEFCIVSAAPQGWFGKERMKGKLHSTCASRRPYKQRPGWENPLPPYGRGSADMEPLSSYYRSSPGSHSYKAGICPGPRPQATSVSFPSTNCTQTPSIEVELFFSMRRTKESHKPGTTVLESRTPGGQATPWLGAQEGGRGGGGGA